MLITLLSRPCSRSHGRSFWKRVLPFFQPKPQTTEKTEEFVHFLGPKNPAVLNGIQVFPNFITQIEHDELVKEAEVLLSKKRYQTSHWDKVINGYRELEIHKSTWSPTQQALFDRIKSVCPNHADWLTYMHILDLAKQGEITSHVDNKEVFGDVIASVSLLSESIIRFDHKETGEMVEVYVPARSLYIMKGLVRYEYGHAIPNGIVRWNDKEIDKGRRISLLFRSEKNQKNQTKE